MEKTETELKKTARSILGDKRIDMLVGYEKGSLPLRSRPCVIKSTDEVDKLVWNSSCSNNLAVYLSRLFQSQPHQKKDTLPLKVGIVTKGCDMRSVVGLLKEKQIPRENIVIIAIPCSGLIDHVKIETILNGEGLADGVESSNGNFFNLTVWQ